MGTGYQMLRRMLNLTCHVLIGIHLYMLCWYSIDSSAKGWYKAHTVLCGAAIAFCCAEGLLMFCPANYTRILSERSHRILHIIWFLVASIMLLVGVILPFTEDAKLKGAHAFLGLTCLILIIISTIVGLMMLASSFRDRKSIRLVHSIIGIIGYILGIITLCHIYIKLCDGHIKLSNICGHDWQMVVMLVAIGVISLIAPVEILIGRGGDFD
ncbi:uncharacterized protein LOC123298274 [Chrysoperla carnea]|uniref:uncharacterized protein LOC123298274 n=1 Tax=Chrysoperla carnea TaxID=189513 RepID=UPI001D05D7D4|nr:uncharacterized protein LOC123298274 [Chrysoperla carnea]